MCNATTPETESTAKHGSTPNYTAEEQGGGRAGPDAELEGGSMGRLSPAFDCRDAHQGCALPGAPSRLMYSAQFSCSRLPCRRPERCVCSLPRSVSNMASRVRERRGIRAEGGVAWRVGCSQSAADVHATMGAIAFASRCLGSQCLVLLRRRCGWPSDGGRPASRRGRIAAKRVARPSSHAAFRVGRAMPGLG